MVLVVHQSYITLACLLTESFCHSGVQLKHCSEDMPFYSSQLAGDKYCSYYRVSAVVTWKPSEKAWGLPLPFPSKHKTQTKCYVSQQQAREGSFDQVEDLACDCVDMVKRNLCTEILAVSTILQTGTGYNPKLCVGKMPHVFFVAGGFCLVFWVFQFEWHIPKLQLSCAEILFLHLVSFWHTDLLATKAVW